MQHPIGIDIGGSGVRAAVIRGGAHTEIMSAPLPDRSSASVVQTVVQLVEKLLDKDEVSRASASDALAYYYYYYYYYY